jgi:dihydroxyacetone kinase
MKKFINDPFDVVDEMLEGFLDVHRQQVRMELSLMIIRALRGTYRMASLTRRW